MKEEPAVGISPAYGGVLLSASATSAPVRPQVSHSCMGMICATLNPKHMFAILVVKTRWIEEIYRVERPNFLPGDGLRQSGRPRGHVCDAFT